MANQARVKILHEVKKENPNGWSLCFQFCRYEYSDDSEQEGYRFIWRKPDGNLQGARGQARIPCIADALELMSLAMRNGWGHYLGPQDGNENIE